MKCITCPVRTGLPCMVELDADRFAVFCEWSRSKDPVLVKTVASRAEIASPPADTAQVEVVQAEIGISGQLLLVYSCDYRTDALDECSCTARKHCGMLRGPFQTEPWAVGLSDCLQCVTGAR